jgi:hypothetical protein
MKKGLIFLPVVIGLCVMVILSCVVVYAQSTMCKDGGSTGNEHGSYEDKYGNTIHYTPKGHIKSIPTSRCKNKRTICHSQTLNKPSKPQLGDTYEKIEPLLVGELCEACEKNVTCKVCETIKRDGQYYGQTLVACEVKIKYTYRLLGWVEESREYNYMHSKNYGIACF